MSDCMDWEQEERILHRLTDQSTGSTCRQLWGTALMPSETVSVQHKTPEKEREREIFLFLDAVDVWMSEQRRHRRDRGERRQLSPSYTAAVSRPYVRINQKSANTHTHTHTHSRWVSWHTHTHTHTFMQTLLSKVTYSAFRLYIFCQWVFPGNWTHNLCAANTMLYHWATGAYAYRILHIHIFV